MKKLKQEIKTTKEEKHKQTYERILSLKNENDKRLLELSTQTGVSNWLTVLPITEFGFELSKQQFWDSIRLRYGWDISNLPTTCPCGSKFDIQHCMSCKKGGFVSIRHNDLRDLTANMVSEVCKDTEIEPRLTPLSGEELRGRTSNNSNEARVDIRTRGFWERGQQAFFDLRVFDPNACRYRNKSLQQCHITNEQEKKRAYNERIMQIDHGTFTPLVFSIYGSMARECQKFYSRLAELISEKRNLPKSITSNWVRTKICFGLLKSSLLCLRGSRTVCRKVAEFEVDVDVSYNIAKI